MNDNDAFEPITAPLDAAHDDPAEEAAAEETPAEVSEDAAATRPPSGWHPVNVGHLVMGVAFVGLVVVWAVLASDTVELDETRWLLPLPWLVAGGVGLVASVVRPRRKPKWAAYETSGTMQGWQ